MKGERTESAKKIAVMVFVFRACSRCIVLEREKQLLSGVLRYAKRSTLVYTGKESPLRS